MNVNKLKYSKCPYCKKHGIPASKFGHAHSLELTCKYCDKTYKVNEALRVLLFVGTAFILGFSAKLINTYLIEIPPAVWIILGIMVFKVFEYFSPLEEIKKEN